MSRPLFHSDSEEEEEEEDPLGQSSKPNFFGDSENEDDEMRAEPYEVLAPQKRAREEEDDEIIEEIPPPSASWKARSPPKDASSSSAASSPDAVDEDDEIEESSPPPARSSPPSKRRRISPPSAPAHLTSSSPPGPNGGSAITKPPYLGEMIIAEAWATTTGKSLLAVGDSVHIHKELKDEPVKNTSKDASKATKGKQMKLTAMMKKAPAKPSKKQAEGAIVRFSNGKGQEIGRLPSKTSAWVSRLLDNNVVDIQGVVVDCPPKIQTGCHIMLSLRFYLRPSAFINPSASLMYRHSRPKDWDLMPEGAETAEEKNLSERKRSLTELFDALSLRPRYKKATDDLDSALAFTKEKKGKASSSSVKGKQKAVEVIGEGEDAEEVELEGEELTGQELNAIYKKAQLHDREMPEMDPPPSFALVLRPYQRQALRWMHSIESGSRDARDASSMHPLWEEYIFPPEAADGVIDLCEDDVPFYFNPYSGELSLEFPRAERNCRGGILADEMGMGKSIMTSSLLHTSRVVDPSESPDDTGKSAKRRVQGALNFSKNSSRQASTSKPTATLIVAPLTLLSQWKSELERSSKKGTLKAYIYHGTARADLEALVNCEEDDVINVVITSYGTLSSEHAKYARGGASSFYDVDWLRVVLDEAHYIKSRHTKTAKACYALRARRRWCLTGTPIVNRLEDLHSLLHFLRDEPWSDFAFFKSSITAPFLNHDPKCLDVVQIVLESILLRREKTMKDRDGRSIVSLPPKEVKTETLEFSSAERKIYDSIYADAKHAYDAFNAGGAVGKNMSNILAMLMKLRRAVLHPSLIRSRRLLTEDESEDEVMETDAQGKGKNINVDALIDQFSGAADGEETPESKTFAVEVLKDLKSIETQECPLCLDTVQEPVLVPDCHHTMCKECIVDLIQDQEAKGNEGFCPVCQRKPVTEQSLIEVTVRRKMGAENPTSSPAVLLRQNDFVSSTKLDALVRHLRQLREQEPAFRAIVFSQFTGFLDLIRTVLRREGFAEYRLDGSLSQKQRAQVLQEFAEPTREPKVFAISLKAGGVGLNLTNANYVFMMDSWWNSAVEHQAIDRVHRIGQDKPVYVTHFLISRTIEERIVAIQKRKTAIVKSALGGKGKSEQETFENLKIMFSG
ncbi:DNA helicase rad5 [Tulasnella sp. 424]|nr:DNA helicase rad5 [Tulasnella sp. 424]